MSEKFWDEGDPLNVQFIAKIISKIIKKWQKNRNIYILHCITKYYNGNRNCKIPRRGIKENR